MSEKSSSPAVTRAAAILELLASSDSHRMNRGMGLSDIADALELPKSSVYNICQAMVDANLLRKDGGGYRLGRRLAELGTAYLSGVDAVREFHAVCRDLPADFEETVQLAVLGDGLNVIYLARQDGRRPLRLGLSAEIGRSVPANCTGAGKALLAQLPPEELDHRLHDASELTRMTPNSIGDVDTLREELGRVRQRGYAVDNEEVLEGLCCVAASVPTAVREDGLVAISVTSLKEPGQDGPTDHMVDAMKDLVSQLSLRV